MSAKRQGSRFLILLGVIAGLGQMAATSSRAAGFSLRDGAAPDIGVGVLKMGFRFADEGFGMFARGGAMLDALELWLNAGPAINQVYIAYDENDVPVYVGKTSRSLAVREREHNRQRGTTWTLRPVNGAGKLTNGKALALESLIFEENPEFANIRNPIGRANPCYPGARDWAFGFARSNGIRTRYR